jgi:hypothetical protein
VGKRPAQQAADLPIGKPSKDLLSSDLSLVRELQEEGWQWWKRNCPRYDITRGRGHQGKAINASKALPDPPEERGVHALDID